MNTIVATEAKNRFGELLEAIQKEPVKISKKGRPVAVILSMEEYHEMTAKIEDGNKPVSFSWLKEIRESNNPDTAPLNEKDYYEGIEEKYGK